MKKKEKKPEQAPVFNFLNIPNYSVVQEQIQLAKISKEKKNITVSLNFEIQPKEIQTFILLHLKYLTLNAISTYEADFMALRGVKLLYPNVTRAAMIEGLYNCLPFIEKTIVRLNKLNENIKTNELFKIN